MKHRRTFWPALVLGMALWVAVLPAGMALAQQIPAPGKEVRGEFLWMKTVRGEFERVVENVKAAAAVKNFPTNNVRDYEKTFGERIRQLGGGTMPFRHYRIIEFCNVMLAMRTLSEDLRMGVFMPCRMVVFAREENGPVTLVTVNPHFMVAVMENPALKPMAAEVEAVIETIFELVED